MKKLTANCIFFIICISTIESEAQDTIFKINYDKLPVNIIDVRLNDITYALPGADASVIQIIPKREIWKIIYKNGASQLYNMPEENYNELFASQKRNVISFNLISPAFGVTEIGFERSIRHGRSWVIDIGFVGLGYKESGIKNVGGLYGHAGYKFFMKSNYGTRDDRQPHRLQGWYLRPEIHICSYNYNDFDTATTQQYKPKPIAYKVSASYFAFQVALGKQWVFDDGLLIDAYASVGTSYFTKLDAQYNMPVPTDYVGDIKTFGMINSPDIIFSGSIGIRVGGLIK